MPSLAEASTIPEFNMSEYENRYPAVTHIVSLFDYNHLPPHLKLVSHKCCRLAFDMCDRLADGPELSVALRSLLEAKDAFVRQAVIDFRNEGELLPAES